MGLSRPQLVVPVTIEDGIGVRVELISKNGTRIRWVSAKVAEALLAGDQAFALRKSQKGNLLAVKMKHLVCRNSTHYCDPTSITVREMEANAGTLGAGKFTRKAKNKIQHWKD